MNHKDRWGRGNFVTFSFLFGTLLILKTIKEHDPDIIGLQETKLSSEGLTKKQTEILEEQFPQYEIVQNNSMEPARKGYAGTLFLYKNHLTPSVSFPMIGAPGTMDMEGRIITLEFKDFYEGIGAREDYRALA